jgi:hypothetical protein
MTVATKQKSMTAPAGRGLSNAGGSPEQAESVRTDLDRDHASRGGL